MLAQRYLPRRVVDLKKSDLRVCVMGKVASSTESSFVVEDESGSADVFSEFPVQAGEMVRVFCTSIDGRLKADAVQSLNGLDLNLYQKVQELYRKVGL